MLTLQDFQILIGVILAIVAMIGLLHWSIGSEKIDTKVSSKNDRRIGKYAQWSSQGVYQFGKPRRIEDVHDGYVFFAGSSTGIPQDQIIIIRKPSVKKRLGIALSRAQEAVSPLGNAARKYIPSAQKTWQRVLILVMALMTFIAALVFHYRNQSVSWKTSVPIIVILLFMTFLLMGTFGVAIPKPSMPSFPKWKFPDVSTWQWKKYGKPLLKLSAIALLLWFLGPTVLGTTRSVYYWWKDFVSPPQYMAVHHGFTTLDGHPIEIVQNEPVDSVTFVVHKGETLGVFIPWTHDMCWWGKKSDGQSAKALYSTGEVVADNGRVQYFRTKPGVDSVVILSKYSHKST